jgi:hypothetical protein
MAEIVTNIDGVVETVNLVERVSAKSGKPYTVLQVKLDNGYNIENFPEPAVKFMIETLVKEKTK